MSGELIRRQDVLDTLCKTCGGVGINGCRVYGIDYPCDEIVAVVEIPSVDAVEVIRCRDCRNWRPHEAGVYGDCAYKCNGYRREDFFCADGERKSE